MCITVLRVPLLQLSIGSAVWLYRTIICFIYLSNYPTWCTTFLFYNKFISCLCMFRAHVLIIRRSKFHMQFYLGILVLVYLFCLFCITTFYVLLTVHLSIFISVINQLDAQNFCFTISLFHVSTCFEHMCSKHVETRNKLIVKQKCCASSWLITEINILRYTVSKTSKFINFMFYGRDVSYP